MKKLILFIALSITTLPLTVSVLTEDQILSIEASKQRRIEETCMAKALYYEAGNQPVEGIRAVYEVIRNRAEKKNTSWCRVISERKQFSFLNSGKISLYSDLKKDEKKLFDAVKSLDNVLSNDVLFYHATYVKPAWSKKMVVDKRIGQHIFYKLREKK